MSWANIKKNFLTPFGLIFLMIIFMGFTYYPILNLSNTNGVHFKITIPLILLSIISITYLVQITAQYKRPKINDILITFAVFSVYQLLSLLWTSNLTRGFVITCFTITIALTWFFIHLNKREINKKITKIYKAYFYTVIFLCIWALWQLIGDALGVSESLTLVPDTYDYSVFGFARPTSFSQEPQFFANFLLAPSVISLFLLSRKNLSKKAKIVAIFIVTTLFLTLSRGAIYGLAISLISLSIIDIYKNKSILTAVSYFKNTFICLVVCLSMIFVCAGINTQDSVNGWSSVRGYINHLTIGLIDLPKEPEAHAIDNPLNISQSEPKVVIESSNSRISMSKFALEIWSDSPKNIIFGTGIGSFSKELTKRHPEQSPDSITNNYYVEILCELGIIGILIFIFTIILIYKKLLKSKKYIELCIINGFLFQWLFFSGNVNTISIWIIIPIFIVLSDKLSDCKYLTS